MKFQLVNRVSTKVAALLVGTLILLVPAVHATTYTAISISRTDSSVSTWFTFKEAGHITSSSSGDCSGSQCFSYQLNTMGSSLSDYSNFYQAIMFSIAGYLYFNDEIGCNGTSCAYGADGSEFSTDVNNTNDVFVLAINAGSSTEGYTVTSCNVSFNVGAQTFYGMVINMSTCTTSNTFSDNGATQGDWGSSAIYYLESVGVGTINSAHATFHTTQITGEMFQYEDYSDDYSTVNANLTGETSNLHFNFGTFGDVIPLCYYSPDTTNPC